MRNRHLVFAASAVFFSGGAIFAAGFALPFAALVIAGFVGALAIIWTARGDDADVFLDAKIDARLWAGCAAAALAIFLLAGAGHFLYANVDWLTRDAVLADVVTRGPKAVYGYEGRDYLLRAPLGMYILPGLIGRAFGTFAAHMGLLAQNTFLLSAILYLLGSMAPGRRAAFLALFLVFSGLKILPTLYQSWQDASHGGAFELPQHIDVWNGWFSFSSHATLLFWVPNHVLSGWWLAALVLTRARARIDLATLVASIAPLMFWSPLAILLAPLAALYFAACAPAREFSRARNWLAGFSGLAFLPLAAYLTSGSGAISSGWLVAAPGFWAIFALFLVVEIPHAGVVLGKWSLVDQRDRGLLLLSLAMLAGVLLYRFGPFNDFAMRGSIGPLAVLAFVFASVVSRLDPATQPVSRLAAILLIAIGAFSAILETTRGFERARYAISDCTLMQSWHEIDHSELPTNYIAPVDSMPAWLFDPSTFATPQPFVERACWPDHPLPAEIHRASNKAGSGS